MTSGAVALSSDFAHPLLIVLIMSMINSSPQPNNQSLPAWFVALALGLILILGAVFRLTGVNWDEDQHLHPDERFLTMVSSALSIPGLGNAGTPPANCAKWGGYFDSDCSPLSPYNHNYNFFVYGTFPIFLTRLMAEFLNQSGYGEIHLLGRVLSALFDLSTVLLIFLIGRRLYGTRAALLGALFLAASVLDIQQSHFYTVDTFTNVPILLAFWYALDIADRKHWQAFIFAGAMFGLALAGRINIAPFVAVIVAASALTRVVASASIATARACRCTGIVASRFIVQRVCARHRRVGDSRLVHTHHLSHRATVRGKRSTFLFAHASPIGFQSRHRQYPVRCCARVGGRRQPQVRGQYDLY
jgi:hypothetical protein